MKMCSIYDSKSEAWLNPLFFMAVGQAIRSFSDVVNDGKSEYAKHPEDYTLFLLGTFDEASGKVDVLPAPVALSTGVAVVRVPVDDNQIALFPRKEA